MKTLQFNCMTVLTNYIYMYVLTFFLLFQCLYHHHINVLHFRSMMIASLLVRQHDQFKAFLKNRRQRTLGLVLHVQRLGTMKLPCFSKASFAYFLQQIFKQEIDQEGFNQSFNQSFNEIPTNMTCDDSQISMIVFVVNHV